MDNRYIYRHLVQQFRDVKAQRQIILATHNATIVTNSMTDQVVIMESDGAHAWIESQGYVSEKFIKTILSINWKVEETHLNIRCPYMRQLFLNNIRK